VVEKKFEEARVWSRRRKSEEGGVEEARSKSVE
jgi:hypothetical protein